MSVGHLDSTSAGPYTVVEGQVDADVTGVTLVRSDGEGIQASTGSGWFVAWWPGSLDATSAEITTASGVTTEPLNTPPPPPSGSGACDQNSQTASSIVCTGGGVGGGTGGTSTGAAGEGGVTNSVNSGGYGARRGAESNDRAPASADIR